MSDAATGPCCGSLGLAVAEKPLSALGLVGGQLSAQGGSLCCHLGASTKNPRAEPEGHDVENKTVKHRLSRLRETAREESGRTNHKLKVAMIV